VRTVASAEAMRRAAATTKCPLPQAVMRCIWACLTRIHARPRYSARNPDYRRAVEGDATGGFVLR